MCHCTKAASKENGLKERNAERKTANEQDNNLPMRMTNLNEFLVKKGTRQLWRRRLY